MTHTETQAALIVTDPAERVAVLTDRLNALQAEQQRGAAILRDAARHAATTGDSRGLLLVRQRMGSLPGEIVEVELELTSARLAALDAQRDAIRPAMEQAQAAAREAGEAFIAARDRRALALREAHRHEVRVSVLRDQRLELQRRRDVLVRQLTTGVALVAAMGGAQ